jgi:hypothetical protein
MFIGIVNYDCCLTISIYEIWVFLLLLTAEYKFEAGLSNDDRRFAHLLAQKMGFKSKSYG